MQHTLSRYLTFICMFVLLIRRLPCATRTYTLFPYTTLFRSDRVRRGAAEHQAEFADSGLPAIGNDARDLGRRFPGDVAIGVLDRDRNQPADRKSTRLNSSH